MPCIKVSFFRHSIVLILPLKMIMKIAWVHFDKIYWNTPSAGTGPWTHRMPFPEKGGPQNCPVVGCLGRVATRMSMWVHFLHRNVLDTVVIL